MAEALRKRAAGRALRGVEKLREGDVAGAAKTLEQAEMACLEAWGFEGVAVARCRALRGDVLAVQHAVAGASRSYIQAAAIVAKERGGQPLSRPGSVSGADRRRQGGPPLVKAPRAPLPEPLGSARASAHAMTAQLPPLAEPADVAYHSSGHLPVPHDDDDNGSTLGGSVGEAEYAMILACGARAHYKAATAAPEHSGPWVTGLADAVAYYQRRCDDISDASTTSADAVNACLDLALALARLGRYRAAGEAARSAAAAAPSEDADAASRIEAVVSAVDARWRRLAAHRAGAAILGALRRYTQRMHRHRAAARIQARYRGNAARERTDAVRTTATREGAAATKIQAVHRGNAARAEAKARKQARDEYARQDTAVINTHEHAAATRIQAVQRGKQARAEADARREAMRQHAAATKIQAVQRGNAARAGLRGAAGADGCNDAAASATGSASADDRREQAAAIKIQAVHRGNAARVEAHARKQARARETTAATKIQAVQRGKRARAEADARREAKREHAAATKIQAMQRGNAARANMGKRGGEGDEGAADAVAAGAEEHAAATRIQAVQRGRHVRAEARSRRKAKDEESAAVKIQAMHRGNAARAQAQARKRAHADHTRETTAATKIQSIQRGRAARARTQRMAEAQQAYNTVGAEEHAAASRIQAVQRGRQARAEAGARRVAKREHLAAAKIQAVHRGNASRRRRRRMQDAGGEGESTAEEVAAATKIQAVQRGRVARRAHEARVEEHAREHRAATVIQARARGVAGRRAHEERRQQRREETAAAVKIQALHRGQVGRRRHAAARNEQRAAVRIQSATRARLARRELAKRRQHAADERAAAIRIQAAHRGVMGRRTAAEAREAQRRQHHAATRIQAVHRGNAGRRAAEGAKQAAREGRAATRIQALHRGRAGRRYYVAERERRAAVRIQARQRGNADRARCRGLREEHTAQEMAATRIQAVYRGGRARQRAQRKRERREAAERRTRLRVAHALADDLQRLEHEPELEAPTKPLDAPNGNSGDDDDVPARSPPAMALPPSTASPEVLRDGDDDADTHIGDSVRGSPPPANAPGTASSKQWALTPLLAVANLKMRGAGGSAEKRDEYCEKLLAQEQAYERALERRAAAAGTGDATAVDAVDAELAGLALTAEEVRVLRGYKVLKAQREREAIAAARARSIEQEKCEKLIKIVEAFDPNLERKRFQKEKKRMARERSLEAKIATLEDDLLTYERRRVTEIDELLTFADISFKNRYHEKEVKARAEAKRKSRSGFRRRRSLAASAPTDGDSHEDEEEEGRIGHEAVAADGDDATTRGALAASASVADARRRSRVTSCAAASSVPTRTGSIEEYEELKHRVEVMEVEVREKLKREVELQERLAAMDDCDNDNDNNTLHRRRSTAASHLSNDTLPRGEPVHEPSQGSEKEKGKEAHREKDSIADGTTPASSVARRPRPRSQEGSTAAPAAAAGDGGKDSAADIARELAELDERSRAAAARAERIRRILAGEADEETPCAVHPLAQSCAVTLPVTEGASSETGTGSDSGSTGTIDSVDEKALAFIDAYVELSAAIATLERNGGSQSKIVELRLRRADLEAQAAEDDDTFDGAADGVDAFAKGFITNILGDVLSRCRNAAALTPTLLPLAPAKRTDSREFVKEYITRLVGAAPLETPPDRAYSYGPRASVKYVTDIVNDVISRASTPTLRCLTSPTAQDDPQEHALGLVLGLLGEDGVGVSDAFEAMAEATKPGMGMYRSRSMRSIRSNRSLLATLSPRRDSRVERVRQRSIRGLAAVVDAHGVDGVSAALRLVADLVAARSRPVSRDIGAADGGPVADARRASRAALAELASVRGEEAVPEAVLAVAALSAGSDTAAPGDALADLVELLGDDGVPEALRLVADLAAAPPSSRASSPAWAAAAQRESWDALGELLDLLGDDGVPEALRMVAVLSSMQRPSRPATSAAASQPSSAAVGDDALGDLMRMLGDADMPAALRMVAELRTPRPRQARRARAGNDGPREDESPANALDVLLNANEGTRLTGVALVAGLVGTRACAAGGAADVTTAADVATPTRVLGASGFRGCEVVDPPANPWRPDMLLHDEEARHLLSVVADAQHHHYKRKVEAMLEARDDARDARDREDVRLALQQFASVESTITARREAARRYLDTLSSQDEGTPSPSPPAVADANPDQAPPVAPQRARSPPHPRPQPATALEMLQAIVADGAAGRAPPCLPALQVMSEVMLERSGVGDAAHADVDLAAGTPASPNDPSRDDALAAVAQMVAQHHEAHGAPSPGWVAALQGPRADAAHPQLPGLSLLASLVDEALPRGPGPFGLEVAVDVGRRAAGKGVGSAPMADARVADAPQGLSALDVLAAAGDTRRLSAVGLLVEVRRRLSAGGGDTAAAAEATVPALRVMASAGAGEDPTRHLSGLALCASLVGAGGPCAAAPVQRSPRTRAAAAWDCLAFVAELVAGHAEAAGEAAPGWAMGLLAGLGEMGAEVEVKDQQQQPRVTVVGEDMQLASPASPKSPRTPLRPHSRLSCASRASGASHWDALGYMVALLGDDVPAPLRAVAAMPHAEPSALDSSCAVSQVSSATSWDALGMLADMLGAEVPEALRAVAEMETARRGAQTSAGRDDATSSPVLDSQSHAHPANMLSVDGAPALVTRPFSACGGRERPAASQVSAVARGREELTAHITRARKVLKPLKRLLKLLRERWGMLADGEAEPRGDATEGLEDLFAEDADGSTCEVSPSRPSRTSRRSGDDGNARASSMGHPEGGSEQGHGSSDDSATTRDRLQWELEEIEIAQAARERRRRALRGGDDGDVAARMLLAGSHASAAPTPTSGATTTPPPRAAARRFLDKDDIMTVSSTREKAEVEAQDGPSEKDGMHEGGDDEAESQVADAADKENEAAARATADAFLLRGAARKEDRERNAICAELDELWRDEQLVDYHDLKAQLLELEAGLKEVGDDAEDVDAAAGPPTPTSTDIASSEVITRVHDTGVLQLTKLLVRRYLRHEGGEYVGRESELAALRSELAGVREMADVSAHRALVAMEKMKEPVVPPPPPGLALEQRRERRDARREAPRSYAAYRTGEEYAKRSVAIKCKERVAQHIAVWYAARTKALHRDIGIVSASLPTVRSYATEDDDDAAYWQEQADAQQAFLAQLEAEAAAVDAQHQERVALCETMALRPASPLSPTPGRQLTTADGVRRRPVTQVPPKHRWDDATLDAALALVKTCETNAEDLAALHAMCFPRRTGADADAQGAADETQQQLGDGSAAEASSRRYRGFLAARKPSHPRPRSTLAAGGDRGEMNRTYPCTGGVGGLSPQSIVDTLGTTPTPSFAATARAYMAPVPQPPSTQQGGVVVYPPLTRGGAQGWMGAKVPAADGVLPGAEVAQRPTPPPPRTLLGEGSTPPPRPNPRMSKSVGASMYSPMMGTPVVFYNDTPGGGAPPDATPPPLNGMELLRDAWDFHAGVPAGHTAQALTDAHPLPERTACPTPGVLKPPAPLATGFVLPFPALPPPGATTSEQPRPRAGTAAAVAYPHATAVACAEARARQAFDRRYESWVIDAQLRFARHTQTLLVAAKVHAKDVAAGMKVLKWVAAGMRARGAVIDPNDADAKTPTPLALMGADSMDGTAVQKAPAGRPMDTASRGDVSASASTSSPRLASLGSSSASVSSYDDDTDSAVEQNPSASGTASASAPATGQLTAVGDCGSAPPAFRVMSRQSSAVPGRPASTLSDDDDDPYDDEWTADVATTVANDTGVGMGLAPAPPGTADTAGGAGGAGRRPRSAASSSRPSTGMSYSSASTASEAATDAAPTPRRPVSTTTAAVGAAVRVAFTPAGVGYFLRQVAKARQRHAPPRGLLACFTLAGTVARVLPDGRVVLKYQAAGNARGDGVVTRHCHGLCSIEEGHGLKEVTVPAECCVAADDVPRSRLPPPTALLSASTLHEAHAVEVAAGLRRQVAQLRDVCVGEGSFAKLLDAARQAGVAEVVDIVLPSHTPATDDASTSAVHAPLTPADEFASAFDEVMYLVKRVEDLDASVQAVGGRVATVVRAVLNAWASRHRDRGGFDAKPLEALSVREMRVFVDAAGHLFRAAHAARGVVVDPESVRQGSVGVALGPIFSKWPAAVPAPPPVPMDMSLIPMPTPFASRFRPGERSPRPPPARGLSPGRPCPLINQDVDMSYSPLGADSISGYTPYEGRQERLVGAAKPAPTSQVRYVRPQFNLRDVRGGKPQGRKHPSQHQSRIVLPTSPNKQYAARPFPPLEDPFVNSLRYYHPNPTAPDKDAPPPSYWSGVALERPAAIYGRQQPRRRLPAAARHASPQGRKQQRTQAAAEATLPAIGSRQQKQPQRQRIRAVDLLDEPVGVAWD